MPRLTFFLACVWLAATIAGGRMADALTIKPGSAWSDPEIPVCWEQPDRKHRQERRMVRKAVGWTWERESAVKFTGWGTCREGEGGIRIALQPLYPQAKGRGREIDGIEAGIILPSLWSLAALSVNLQAPVHEFGHALGFGHEYAREDVRDPERCNRAGKAGTLYTEFHDLLTPFDPDSVMIGCLASATRQFSTGVPKLSAADIFGLVMTYGSNPDNVLDIDETGDRFGAALTLRDLDDDGVVDLAVGAPGEDGGRGSVYVYRGDAHKGFRPWRRIHADDAGDGMNVFGSAFGAQASSLIVLGEAASGRVATEVRLEPKLTLSATAVTSAEVSDLPELPGRLGFGFPEPADFAREDRVVLSGDLDGDGLEDAVVGLPSASAGAEASGAVVVLRAERIDGEVRLRPWYWFGQAY